MRDYTAGAEPGTQSLDYTCLHVESLDEKEMDTIELTWVKQHGYFQEDRILDMVSHMLESMRGKSEWEIGITRSRTRKKHDRCAKIVRI